MATSGISRTRATNLTGLIDIDALVEANLIRQKTKLKTATQKLKIEQYKQEQYREIQSKAKQFYNKYFDILSGDSLFNAKTYNVMKAKTTDASNVTATASTKAKAGNYSVTVNSAATSAKYQLDSASLLATDKIAINNEVYTLTGRDAKEKAENLSKQLEENGANVTASYSQFVDNGNGGLIIQTKDTGVSAELSIFLGTKAESAFSSVTVEAGKDATSEGLLDTDAFFGNIGANSSISWDDLKEGKYFSINGEEIKIDHDAIVQMCNGDYSKEKKLSILADALNKGINDNADLKGKYTAEVQDGNVVFKAVETGELGTAKIFTCKVNGSDKNVIDGFNAKSDAISLGDIIGAGANSDLIINGETINFNKTGTDEAQRTSLKNALAAKGYTLNDDNTIENTSKKGSIGNFTCEIRDNLSCIQDAPAGTDVKDALGKVLRGTDASVVIKDLNTGLQYTHTGQSNEVTLDEITFKIDANAKAGSTTNISVKADGTELKDKIVEFINEYNDLLGSINTKLFEKYDRSYLPLTDEDKEGLTDKQIEQLEKKAQTGLLKNDDLLYEFANDMKMSMATVMKKEWGGSSVGLSLEKIGIKPVQDYTTQNGLFTIDEDALLEAIENNIDGVKELFTRGMSNSSSSDSDGIFVKLKNDLYEHATGTFSRLADRAGVADGVTANTNQMTKDIEERKKQITAMEQALKDKEDALYTRYSRLESSLAALQSQQSSLASYFQ